MNQSKQSQARRGAATVEFALVAPVFLALVLGVTETSRIFEVKNQLAVAAREGARMAAMDRSGLVAEGQSTNSKVVADVKNFLKASGINPEDVNVEIVSHDDPTAAFDLDAAANSLKYFELKISVPFDAASTICPDELTDVDLESKIVFRNAKTN